MSLFSDEYSDLWGLQNEKPYFENFSLSSSFGDDFFESAPSAQQQTVSPAALFSPPSPSRAPPSSSAPLPRATHELNNFSSVQAPAFQPSAPMPSAPMQSAPMQAAPMQAAPMQAAPMQAAPVRASMQAASMQPAPIQSAPMQSPVPMQSTPIQSAPMHSIPMHSIPMQSVPMQSVPLQTAQPTPTTSFSHPMYSSSQEYRRPVSVSPDSGYSSPATNSPYSSPPQFYQSPSPNLSGDSSPSPSPGRIAKLPPQDDPLMEVPDARKRKRRKYVRQEDVKPTSVTLPRERLLTMTLVEMDEFISKMRATRRLNDEEDQDLKRQRRLVKNRESALASRNRKKEETEQLEDQVSRLVRENSAQREQINRLEAENNSLKNEVMHLNQVLGGSPSLSGDSYREMIRSFEIGHSSPKVAGITVMLLLFSFGALLAPMAENEKGLGPFPFMATPVASPPKDDKDESSKIVEVTGTQSQWTLDVSEDSSPVDSKTQPESVSQPKPAEIISNEKTVDTVSSGVEKDSSVQLIEEVRSFVESNVSSSEIEEPVLVQILVPRSVLSQTVASPPVSSPAPSSDLSNSPPANSTSPSPSSSSPSSSSPETSSETSIGQNTTSTTLKKGTNNLMEVSCKMMNLNHAVPLATENLMS